MTHPALYLPTGRIAFLPTRIVRAFNDNVAAVSLLPAADGAGAVLLDCLAAPAAGFAPFHEVDNAR
jgi:hypothetical protein